jgi:hypothetical protein
VDVPGELDLGAARAGSAVLGAGLAGFRAVASIIAAFDDLAPGEHQQPGCRKSQNTENQTCFSHGFASLVICWGYYSLKKNIFNY